MARAKLSLNFAASISSVVRSRMNYAFRIFAAIYDYEVAATAESADFSCFYGEQAVENHPENVLLIPARYTPRIAPGTLPRLRRVRYANEELYLIHGTDEVTGHPDWLGEIFEWLSCSLELSIHSRDSVGRIPYHETVFAKQNVPPLKPHAALLMAWMENVVQNGGAVEALPKATSPLRDTEHIVVCSHDIDFFFTGKAMALRRLSKNLGISLTHYRSPSFLASNLRMVLGLALRERPGDYVEPMLREIEKRGFRSTLFTVAEGSHRRDPSYRLSDVERHLRNAAERGFSVGVHGSYSSVIERNSLAEEVTSLERSVGRRPLGSRQHWLRFDSHKKLFRAIESARLAYDSSLGFTEVCGFRNGANFAFPPYDFDKEQPYPILEIPLVIMDGSLPVAARMFHTTARELCDQLLRESRKWGWGGIGILWHNPMEPIQVPDEVNRVFWVSAENRHRYAEQWMSADQFLAVSLARYQAAGLFKEARFDA